MAFRVKFKLPRLNVMQKHVGDKVVHRSILRSCTNIHPCSHSDHSAEEDTEHQELPSSHDTDMDMEYLMESCTSTEALNLPSLHQIREKAATEAWGRVRNAMPNMAIECNSMPMSQMCKKCESSEATHRCVQCAPWAYFCSNCYEAAHTSVNIFHVGEVWDFEVSNRLVTVV